MVTEYLNPRYSLASSGGFLLWPNYFKDLRIHHLDIRMLIEMSGQHVRFSNFSFHQTWINNINIHSSGIPNSSFNFFFFSFFLLPMYFRYRLLPKRFVVNQIPSIFKFLVFSFLPPTETCPKSKQLFLKLLCCYFI